MAGGMQPARPDGQVPQSCPRPQPTEQSGSAALGSLGVTDCQLHRSVTSSPKHPNVRCEDVKLSPSPECPGLRSRKLHPTAWLLILHYKYSVSRLLDT